MHYVDVDALRATPLATDPFEHVIVSRFVKQDRIAAINASFPSISRGGAFPLETVDPSTPLRQLINELDGADFEAAVAEKFGVTLAGRPKLYSLRGYVRSEDGKIHTDSRDKIITVLLYLNERWDHPAGRLRLLRDGTDLENYAVEVPPDQGTLLVFKRGERSWHGHHPYEGPRRALQMNWMTSEGARGLHAIRHKLSAALKNLRAFRPYP